MLFVIYYFYVLNIKQA